MSTIIQVANLSKIYRLGEIGTGTISRDLERWYKMKIKGQTDPFLKIGETNDRSKKGDSDIVYSLRDINFEVQQGEALGIIGKNGAGKSTLLKVLSRVTSPSAGKVKIKGRVASLLEVGTGFHPELTGRENIYLNGAILGMRKKEITRKLDEIIDFSGVERYIDTPVKRYSSGMYVRLAFAVAAHLESETLIVDEVLAVGDAEFQKKCLGKMSEVSKGEGRTVLFVSHNMGAIRGLCQNGIVLNNGCLIESKHGVEEAISLYTNNVFSDFEYDIEKRKDRNGTGELKILEFYLNNKKNSSEISIDEQMIFNIKYSAIYDNFIGNVLLSINTLDNQCVSFFESAIIEDFTTKFRRNGKITLKISNDFALAPNRYYINIAILVNGQIADHIQRAILFNVTDGLFFSSGKTPIGKGLCFIKQKWEINHE